MRHNRRHTLTLNNGPIMIEFNKRAENVDNFINRANVTSNADADVKYLIHDLKSMVYHTNEMIKHSDTDCIIALQRLSDAAYNLFNIGRAPYDKWAQYAYDAYEKMEDEITP